MKLPIRLSIEQFIDRHKIQSEILEKEPVVKDIHRVYELIDTKASALLSHVAIMIAVCTFFYSSSNSNSFFLIEAFIYMCITLVLLFSIGLSMYGDFSNKEKMKEYYAYSCRKRATIYLLALWLTKLVTFLVLLTIASEWLL